MVDNGPSGRGVGRFCPSLTGIRGALISLEDDYPHHHSQHQARFDYNTTYQSKLFPLNMSFRLALNTTRQTLRSSPRLASCNRTYSAASTPGPVSLPPNLLSSADRQVREFFAHGVPIVCYPIIGVTACALSFSVYSISKHVVEDRSHVSHLSAVLVGSTS